MSVSEIYRYIETVARQAIVGPTKSERYQSSVEIGGETYLVTLTIDPLERKQSQRVA